jgi:hypothetical protein
MKLEPTLLPWTGAPVQSIENLREYLIGGLPEGASEYLPRSITLFVDPGIEESEVESFVSEMTCALKCELQRRMGRRSNLVSLGLFTPVEIESFLTERTGVQPWAIYYSRFGGLGISNPGISSNGGAEDRAHGVVPCSSMQNHGVAWSHDSAGRIHVWLATARKEGQGWDWDSDIGHESAHAAFAQVPLFTQLLSKAIDQSPLSEVDSVRNLNTAHLARITYFYSEIAVVAVRGESRPTQTTLPVAELAEMRSLLKLSNDLAPDCGFKNALTAFERANGVIDVNSRNEIYEIAAPMMKTIPYLTRFVNQGNPPDILAFRRAIEEGRREVV